MKAHTLLATLLAAALLTACSNGGSEEYHSTYFYPLGDGMTAYADQTADTCRVISYDTWTLTQQATWLTASVDGKDAPATVTVPTGYIVNSRVAVSFEPNTTGQTRYTTLTANSTAADIGAIVYPVCQYAHLNVILPATTAEKADTLTLEAKLKEGESKPFITFRVFSTDATLTGAADWLTLSKDKEFEAGKTTTVELTPAANGTGAMRRDTLYLTSNGVTTPIYIRQKAS